DRWLDSLPLTESAPYAFTEDTAEIQRLKSKSYLDLNSYATAEETFYWLKERYGLQAYSDADARAIGGVRYEMEKQGYYFTEKTAYALSSRYDFAEDIALETAVLIRQSNALLPGVDVAETARRAYVDGALAPHLIGRIGAIFPNELESYLALGYSRDDLVGKEGIEKAFESSLRGIDGVRRIELSAAGSVTGMTEERAPTPGNTISLTIDKHLQQVAADALRREIRLLNETAPAGEGREADAGAVVVIDIKRSEVLAAVTYPTYDLSTYSEDYAANSANPLYPFLNRALSGIYAPGSCFKPVTAVAGLSEGVITPETRVNCQRVYTFYPTYQPSCLYYNGPVTVIDALRVSCNVFFYDTGRQLGIERMNAYARSLGLGVKTGIELSEATGTQNDPDSINPGDALQTAIGQLDNGYSPIQLANYTATLARSGVRMKLSLVKSESSYYDLNHTVRVHEPEIAETLEVPPGVFETVREGMVQASHSPNQGTAYRYLGDYPIRIASKTGTPQTHDYPNSTFICYAPADDPQIAIAGVIEKGWHGYTGAPVARTILDAYFFPDKARAQAEAWAKEEAAKAASSAPAQP
ncbi:MAG: penicillin-binding transpeptidase domain-containing protein, partial [Oscillospiraceae bacterium]